MSFEDWALQFCLTCDKQTDDGAAYCSESCRLADYETNSATSSGPSSPSLNGPSFDWSFDKSNKFHLSPAYNSNTQSSRTLSPSSSHTSLCSMKSTSSAGLGHGHSGMSEKAAKELQAYAHSFESVRVQRRRSSN